MSPTPAARSSASTWVPERSLPRPGPGGDRYPDRIELTTSHRLLLFDADDVGVARLRKRWRGLIDVDQGTEDAIVDRVEFRAEHEKLLR